jgi:ABC-type glycerol-3-phosphate transport system substrate-binding protein
MDTWAMTPELASNVLNAIISSNGANYVEKDADGKFYNATGSQEFLEGIQFALKLRDEGVTMPYPEGREWTWYQPMFTDGITAMAVEPLYMRGNLQNMTDDWGVVMFPMGPRVDNYVAYGTENVLVVPSSFEQSEVEKIVAAVDLWNRPVDESPDAWQNGLWQLYRDARAVTETMVIINDPDVAVMQNHEMIPGLSLGDITWKLWNHEGDPAQLVEAVSASWNALISDANATGSAQ